MQTFVQNSYQIESKDPHFYTLGQKNRNDIDKNLHKKIKEKLHKNYAKIAKNHKKLLKTQNTKKRKNYQKNKKK